MLLAVGDTDDFSLIQAFVFLIVIKHAFLNP